MSKFPDDAHLSSWAAMSFGNNESEGEKKSSKTRRGNNFLKALEKGGIFLQWINSKSLKEGGYFIGSGTIEAAFKTVVGARFKRSGMQWSRNGAQSLLQLRIDKINERSICNLLNY